MVEGGGNITEEKLVMVVRVAVEEVVVLRHKKL